MKKYFRYWSNFFYHKFFVLKWHTKSKEKWQELRLNNLLQNKSLFSFHTRYSRHFAKASGRWTVRPVMENKPYAYIPEILRQVFRKRMQDKQPQQRQAVLSEDDPRRLSSTIYPVPPPSVDELLLSHQPRMWRFILYWSALMALSSREIVRGP